MAFPRFSRETSTGNNHSCKFTEVDILDQRLAVLNDLYSFLQTQLEVKHSNKLEPWKARHFFAEVVGDGGRGRNFNPRNDKCQIFF